MCRIARASSVAPAQRLQSTPHLQRARGTGQVRGREVSVTGFTTVKRGRLLPPPSAGPAGLHVCKHAPEAAAGAGAWLAGSRGGCCKACARFVREGARRCLTALTVVDPSGLSWRGKGRSSRAPAPCRARCRRAGVVLLNTRIAAKKKGAERGEARGGAAE